MRLLHTAGRSPSAMDVDVALRVMASARNAPIGYDGGRIVLVSSGGASPTGRPSLGSWLSYGLGAENQDLPAFAVMTPTWTGRQDAQALYNRLWGAGMLASKHSGVALRAQGDPVLFLKNPEGVDRASRRRMLDSLAAHAAFAAKVAVGCGVPSIRAKFT